MANKRRNSQSASDADRLENYDCFGNSVQDFADNKTLDAVKDAFQSESKGNTEMNKTLFNKLDNDSNSRIQLGASCDSNRDVLKDVAKNPNADKETLLRVLDDNKELSRMEFEKDTEIRKSEENTVLYAGEKDTEHKNFVKGFVGGGIAVGTVVMIGNKIKPYWNDIKKAGPKVLNSATKLLKKG